MGCGEKMAKMFVFVFNAVFFLCGVALLAIGIWIIVDKSSLVKMANEAGASEVSNHLTTTSLVEYAAYLIIAVGAFTFVAGFCGCCGACTENLCLLRIYAFLVGLMLILQLAGVIIAAVFKGEMESKLKEGLIAIQNETYIGLPKGIQSNSTSLALDVIMISLKCCGIDGSDDFTKNFDTKAYKWYTEGRNLTNGNTLTIPYSCCKLTSTDFVKEGSYDRITSFLENKSCGLKNVDSYSNGCFKQIKSGIEVYAIAIIAVGVIIMLVELLGIILTCCLIREFDD